MSALKHAISDYVEMVGKRERIVGCPDGRGLIKIEVLHAENVAILSGNKNDAGLKCQQVFFAIPSKGFHFDYKITQTHSWLRCK